MSSLVASILGQSTSSASAPAVEEVGPLITAIVAAGVVVLLVWAFLSYIRPGRFLLRGQRGLAPVAGGRAYPGRWLTAVPARPNSLNAIHLAAVFMLFLATQIVLGGIVGFAMAIAEGYGLSNIGEFHMPVIVSLAIGMVGQCAWIVASLAVARLCFKYGVSRGLGLSGRHWIFDTLRALGGYLAVMPPVILALVLATWLLPKQFRIEHHLLDFVRSAGPLGKAMVVFSAGVLAPVAEEIFFRGLLQSALRKVMGPWPAILVASLAFAGTHVLEEPQAVPALAVLAIALGYSYERTGRLLTPIIIHTIFNMVMIAGTLWK